LRDGAERLAPRVAALKPPFIGVLIGGSNAAYRLGTEEMQPLARQLAASAREKNASLLITPSRRTSPEALRVLKGELAQVPHFLWDGQGDNPYFGILGLADFLVVTCDSVNMVSEAASTGKPVYVVDLPGNSEKFARFHRAMRDDAITRPFAGKLETYSYVPLDDMAMVAARVNALFA
jgi:mitochondrial fission protein ELM1